MENEELKNIFLTEASDSYEELNMLFTELEKNHKSQPTVEAIFRITHTLKANAAAMGYNNISEISHILEDIFSEVKSRRMQLTTAIFNDLFRANDKLGEMLKGIKTGETVRYKGLLVKLKVVLRNAKENATLDQAEENKQETTPKTTSSEENNTNTSTETQEPPKEEISSPVIPEIVTAPTQEEPTSNAPAHQPITLSDTIQVPIKKLDDLLNLVGELAIEKDRIIAQSSDNGLSRVNDYARLYRITSDLQYSVMGVRLVQVSVLFQKFYRIVRDVAAAEHKSVNLQLSGTEIEIDRNVIQTISDSLIHLVRNAISHGIEQKEDRIKQGKPPEGTLKLSARMDKDFVIIEVADDGKGIDAQVIKRKILEKGMAKAEFLNEISEEEIINYIYEPGFSSNDNVTAISGRGVGMDVVKKSVESIGGKTSTSTKLGEGTTFSLFLPASMAVKSALLFALKDAEFAIPLSFTEAVIAIKKEEIHKVSNGLVTAYLDQNIAVTFLNDVFGVEYEEELYEKKLFHNSYDQMNDQQQVHVIVVSFAGKNVGFVVDKLLQQKEIIEKPLGKPVENSQFISGATILGSGNVCLVIDVPALISFMFRRKIIAQQHHKITE